MRVYGDVGGLKLLESTAADLGAMIHRQPGIRIGLIRNHGLNSLNVLYPPLIFDAKKPDCRKIRVAK